MVEALVVIPFFLIIFASILFISALYNQKLFTQRVSMEKSWEAAVEGCESAGGVPLPGSENVDLGQAAAIPATALCSEGFGTVAVTEHKSTTASPLIGAFTRDTSSTTQLVCNEKPASGDFDGAAKFLWDLLEEPGLLE